MPLQADILERWINVIHFKLLSASALGAWAVLGYPCGTAFRSVRADTLDHVSSP